MPIIPLALTAIELVTSLFTPVLSAVEDVTDAIEQELGDTEIKRRYDVLVEAQTVLATKISKERTSLKQTTLSINEKIAKLRAKYGDG